MSYFCFSYTKLNINVISFILSIVFTIICAGFIFSLNKVVFNTKFSGYYENTNELGIYSLSENNVIYNPEKTDIQLVGPNSSETLNSVLSNENIDENSLEEWKIEIPKINLVANISEGTSKELLDEFVGHFENTRKRFWKYRTCCT